MFYEMNIIIFKPVIHIYVKIKIKIIIFNWRLSNSNILNTHAHTDRHTYIYTQTYAHKCIGLIYFYVYIHIPKSIYKAISIYRISKVTSLQKLFFSPPPPHFLLSKERMRKPIFHIWANQSKEFRKVFW